MERCFCWLTQGERWSWTWNPSTSCATITELYLLDGNLVLLVPFHPSKCVGSVAAIWKHPGRENISIEHFLRITIPEAMQCAIHSIYTALSVWDSLEVIVSRLKDVHRLTQSGFLVCKRRKNGGGNVRSTGNPRTSPWGCLESAY